MLLHTEAGDFFGLLAIVCTSFSACNVATSKRSPVVPYGDTSLPYVASGNCCASRSILLAALMQMLGGCWFIEQPASSRLAWYPRFEWLCRSLWSKAWQIGWWARHFKALTPKRHRAWSNSKEISVLNRGVLTKKERDACPVKTTDRSVKVDASGNLKTTWSGNKHLKKTQPRPQLPVNCIHAAMSADCFCFLCSACSGRTQFHLDSTCSATFMSCAPLAAATWKSFQG